MNRKAQSVCLILECLPTIRGAGPEVSVPPNRRSRYGPHGQPLPSNREFLLSVRRTTPLTPNTESAGIPTFVVQLAPKPSSYAPSGPPPSNRHPASSGACSSRFPKASTITRISRYPLGLTQPATMFVLLAAAVFVFVIAAAVLFHEPLTHVFKTRELAEERGLLAARQEAELLALKDAVTERLERAEQSLAELESANDQLTRQVEAIARVPLETTIVHPPMHLRRAILTSDACLYAWTDVINAHVTPQQFDDHRQRLHSIRADLQQGTATQSHRRELDSTLQWIRQRRDTIAVIDLGPLHRDNAIDTQGITRTITLQERR